MPWYADPSYLMAAYLWAWAGVLVLVGGAGAVGLLAFLLLFAGQRRVGDVYVSNCLFFAVGRRVTHGGRIVWRKSKNWWGPHVMWQAPGGEIEQFVPLNPVRRLIPPPLFRGRVARGDPPEPCESRT